MTKMKKYNIFVGGGELVTTTFDTCITKSAKQFIKSTQLDAKVTTLGIEYATIKTTHNYGVCSDYVIMEA